MTGNYHVIVTITKKKTETKTKTQVLTNEVAALTPALQ